MGKRKDKESTSEEGRVLSPKKKHKHKHKKHKKRKETTEDDLTRKERKNNKSKSRDKERYHEPEERSLKIKIKFGGQTITTKQVAKIVPLSDTEQTVTSEDEEIEIENDVEEIAEEEIAEEEIAEEEIADEEIADTEIAEGEIAEESDKSYQLSIQEGGEVEDLKKKKPGSDHEEEEWLNALEAGELDDYGRLKQDKKIGMMTARQRAMLGHEIVGENQLLELPTETRKKDEDSEEAQKKRKLRAKKRKQQMQKQIEDNKAQTVKKLLERETTRAQKDEEKARRQKAQVKPHVRYLSNKSGFSLSYPTGLQFPFEHGTSVRPPKPREKCTAHGCSNDKRYNCSSNNLPVCSLECYKIVKTFTLHRQVTV